MDNVTRGVVELGLYYVLSSDRPRGRPGGVLRGPARGRVDLLANDAGRKGLVGDDRQ